MSFFQPQNPGIGGLDELTDVEALFIQNIANLSYAQGDILYHNGTNIVRLGAGTDGYFLQTKGAGANPIWASAGAGGGAPTDATYIVQTANGTLTNEQALGALATGLLKNTTTTGVLSIATASDIPDLSATYVTKALYDANTILYATTDNTPVALTVGTNTVIGRVAGAITTLAVDSDLTSVSASDDTVASAKAIKTALDLKAPLASPTFTGTLTVPVGLTGVLRADTGVVSVDTDVTDIVSAASDTVAGKIEIATSAEINTGTDNTRAVSPDALAGSEFGKRTVAILVSDPLGDAITTGDGKAVVAIDTTINGMNLVAVKSYVTTVSSSGNPTVQLRRSRRASDTTRTDADMLSTPVSISASEFASADASTAPVINTSNDDVQTGDMIFVDIDTAGTGTKGLNLLLTFQLP